MNATDLIKLPPVEWESAIDTMTTTERGEMVRELERIAIRAAELARYLDERHGYGCGDQGHDSAVKRANKAGKIVWMKAFGYNDFHELRI